MLSRATGALYGQVIGDSLGSLVESETSEEIQARYPRGVRELAAGGPFNLAAGQPTDDSEMAFALARSLIRRGKFDSDDVLETYRRWAHSDPFDIGETCANALLNEEYNYNSLANGALMRHSPLGIYCASFSPEQLQEIVRQDCMLTHINPICVESSQAYVTVLAGLIAGEFSRDGAIEALASYDSAFVQTCVVQEPGDTSVRQGWIGHALQICMYELKYGTSFEESLVRTVGRGGDTDTNAAIVGALLGALYSNTQIPLRWIEAVNSCQPGEGAQQPRPEEYWPTGLFGMSIELLQIGLEQNVADNSKVG